MVFVLILSKQLEWLFQNTINKFSSQVNNSSVLFFNLYNIKFWLLPNYLILLKDDKRKPPEYALNFVIRDSAQDSIYVTAWGSKNYIDNLADQSK